MGQGEWGLCRQTVKVKWITVVGSVKGLAGSGQVLLLKGGSFSSHQRMLCPQSLLPELRDNAGVGVGGAVGPDQLGRRT